MGKGKPTLISRALSNTLSSNSKTQFDFVNLPKKVAVIELVESYPKKTGHPKQKTNFIQEPVY